MNKKRKLFFIHLGKLSNKAGHTARLRYELENMSKVADVSVISLTDQVDQISSDKYPNINFYALPIEFNGWEVVNLNYLIEQIDERINFCNPDIVILCMEIWDLVLELHRKLLGKVAFCAICHAMPFLGSPLNPTKYFESDVRKFINEQMSEYRKDYISKHYKEFAKIINSGLLIANNATVTYYFENYFPKSLFWRQVPHVTVNFHQTPDVLQIEYDFCYMARIEKGKGLEYLRDLFTEISSKLGRKINVAIMGRAEDEYSKQNLKHLIKDINEFYSIHFFGWADDKTKSDVLSKSGCFIYPSIYDNFPTVVNEALSHGLPVALWDTIFYKVNYSGVESISAAAIFDIEHLASIAVNLLKRKTHISHHSIEYIKKNSGSELVARDDLDLFEKIIEYHERNK